MSQEPSNLVLDSWVSLAALFHPGEIQARAAWRRGKGRSRAAARRRKRRAFPLSSWWVRSSLTVDRCIPTNGHAGPCGAPDCWALVR